jgi:isopentenyl diphosphate isomerase/L-lactate dehydrogenase-like FMN-dependent dehydrogenase
LAAQQDTFRDHSRVPGINELVTAFDFEPVAYAKIPRDAYDYTAQGVDGEFTLRRNREAFDWVGIIPKTVVDVSSVRTETEVLGTRLKFPIMVAPSAGQGQLHPQGEIAMYQGSTAAAETPMIVSNNASFPLDKIAPAAQGALWFQLYPRQQIDVSRELIETAQGAGVKAIVITVDQQSSYYERQLHNRALSGSGSAARRTSLRGQTARVNPYRIVDTRLWYDWTFIDAIRPFVKVPLCIKGIVTPEDARLSVEHGIDGILVSNHGGRSLDYGPATLEVLPEIVDVVAGRAPVIVDSGFRRGSDIFKALAIGAKAVCLGRVPRWGLGAYGAQGAQRILEILQTELTDTMAQAGRPDLASIDRSAIRMEFP